MHVLRSWLFVAIAAILAACASNKIPTSYIGTAELPPNSGTIVFYRPSQLYSRGFRPEILVDGKFIWNSVPGTRFKVAAVAGAHTVSVPHGGLSTGSQSLQITVRPGETTYVRTSVSASAFIGKIDVELVPEGVALGEVGSLEALN